jgi:hypothetical protein
LCRPAERDPAIISEITATGFVKGVNLQTQQIETLTRKDNSVMAVRANKSFDFMQLPTEIQTLIFEYIGMSDKAQVAEADLLKSLGREAFRTPMFRFLGKDPHSHLQALHDRWFEKNTILVVTADVTLRERGSLYHPAWPLDDELRPFRNVQLTLEVFHVWGSEPTDHLQLHLLLEQVPATIRNFVGKTPIKLTICVAGGKTTTSWIKSYAQDPAILSRLRDIAVAVKGHCPPVQVQFTGDIMAAAKDYCSPRYASLGRSGDNIGAPLGDAYSAITTLEETNSSSP